MAIPGQPLVLHVIMIRNDKASWAIGAKCAEKLLTKHMDVLMRARVERRCTEFAVEEGRAKTAREDRPVRSRTLGGASWHPKARSWLQ